MPIHLRHQPNMDLRGATMTNTHYKDSDSYSFDSNSESGYETAYEKHVSKDHNLRLATSTPMILNKYQSDEEQLSPSSEEASSARSKEEDFEEDSDLDDVEVISAFEIASRIEVTFTGRPTMISISAMAPMHKRQTSPARPSKVPHSASETAVPRAIPRRSSLRVKRANRVVSMYEPPVQEAARPAPTLITPPAMNFSTPQRTFSPRVSPIGSGSPPQLMEPGSPTSSYADSDSEAMSEADALMLEAEEIQVRTHSMERERQRAFGGEQEGDLLGKPPTPTSYKDYDPFALSPPTLGKHKATEQQQQQQQQSTQVDNKKWKGLGLARRVRMGKKTRETEVGY